MNEQQPRQLFTKVSDEEIMRTRQTAREAKEKAEKEVFLNAIDSIEIKDEDTNRLFTTISDKEVEETRRMAEEAGKRAEEEVYRKAFGLSQTDGESSAYSDGAVLAVEVDEKATRTGINVNYQAEEKKQSVRLFERLNDKEAQKNLCSQNISVKDFCPEYISPCMARKNSDQEEAAMTDRDAPKKSQKGEELSDMEATLSKPSEKKKVKGEAVSAVEADKKTKTKKRTKIRSRPRTLLQKQTDCPRLIFLSA